MHENFSYLYRVRTYRKIQNGAHLVYTSVLDMDWGEIVEREIKLLTNQLKTIDETFSDPPETHTMDEKLDILIKRMDKIDEIDAKVQSA